MAITQLGATTTDFDNTMPTSLTTSRTQPAGTDVVLIVIVSTENDPTHDSVTFDGVSMTKEVESLRAGQRRTSLWYLVNPNVTTANIVVTLGSAGDIAMIAHSWENVDQTTPINASAANDDSPPPDANGDPTITVASASGELAIDGFGHDDDTTDPAPAAGQTELADVQVTGDFRSASSRKDGASPNVTFDWTMTPNDWTAVAASLNPASVAPGEPRTHQMML